MPDPHANSNFLIFVTAIVFTFTCVLTILLQVLIPMWESVK